MADLITNRKAFHDFEVLEKIEAGIALAGTEVKSCRERNLNLTDAYAQVVGPDMWLYNVHISEYSHGNRFNHKPDRPRRLLLHKGQIRKLGATTQQQGYTLVPLRLYLVHGKIKVELGLCRGRQKADKREALKSREAKRDIQRAMRSRG